MWWQRFQIVEGLKTCLSCEKLPEQEGDSLCLRRAILINQTDEDKKNLQTMVKVFVPTTDLNYLHEALEYSKCTSYAKIVLYSYICCFGSMKWNLILICPQFVPLLIMCKYLLTIATISILTSKFPLYFCSSFRSGITFYRFFNFVLPSEGGRFQYITGWLVAYVENFRRSC